MILFDLRVFYLCILLILVFDLSLYSQSLGTETENRTFNQALSFQNRGWADSAIYYYQLLLNNHKGDIDNNMAIECLINLAQTYGNLYNHDSCIHYINKVLQNKLTSLQRAKISTVERKILLREGKLSDAIENIEQAKMEADKHGDVLLLASVLFNYGDYYYYINELDSALVYYNRALNLHMKSKDINIETTLFLENIGFIYLVKEDYIKATEYQDFSFIIKKYVLFTDARQLIEVYIQKGFIYRFQYQYYKAIDMFYTAYRIAEKFRGEDKRKFVLLSNIGWTYSKSDKHELALSYYNKALDIAVKLNDNSLLSQIYEDMGYSYLDVKEYDKALNYFQRSLFIKQGLGEKNISKIYRHMAKAYKCMGDPDKADRFYRLSLEEGRKEPGYKDADLILTLQNYAEFLMIGGKLEMAHCYWEDAKNIAIEQDQKNNYHVSCSYLGIGDYYFLIENYDSALYYYHKSIQSFFTNFSNVDILVLPKKQNIPPFEYSAKCLGKKADALTEVAKSLRNFDSINGMYKTAMENYSLALEIIDRFKFEYKDLNFGLLLAEDFKPIFENAAEAAYNAYDATNEMYYLNKAWMFSEGNKAALIRAMFSENEARDVLNVPMELQEEEKKINNNIVIFRDLIEKERDKSRPDQEKISDLNARLLISFDALDSLASILKRDYPSYFDLKYSTEIESIEDIQKKLVKDQLLIEYFITDESLLIFAIDTDSAKVIKHDIDSNFYNLVERFSNYFRCGQPDFSLDGFNEYCSTSFQLYQMLFCPFEKKIQKKDLIIIPDDILGLMPFEALIHIDPQLSYVDYKNLPYLIKQNSILYEYSASFINKHKKNTSYKCPKVLALVPDYSSQILTKLDTTLEYQQELKDLKPLKGALGEVESISQSYKTKRLLNRDVSEEKLYNLAKKFSILHIAGHTIISDEQPMFSKLVLTLYKDSLYDNLINTYELYNHYMGNKLVVLSGCNTGIGKLRKGEGIISLARGFTYAGCQSIVMTLWSISDNSSAELMSYFYTYLSKGKLKGEALQQAKISFLEKSDPLKSHPYYWAGYICIGNNEAIPDKSNVWWNVSLLFSGLIGISLYLKIRKRNRDTK
ncbi:MAG: CHAT domain-containing protein [Bacteroidales bacterium]|nr:CHAT domain-containing protein [Bacteroidales bacterium]